MQEAGPSLPTPRCSRRHPEPRSGEKRPGRAIGRSCVIFLRRESATVSISSKRKPFAMRIICGHNLPFASGRRRCDMVAASVGLGAQPGIATRSCTAQRRGWPHARWPRRGERDSCLRPAPSIPSRSILARKPYCRGRGQLPCPRLRMRGKDQSPLRKPECRYGQLISGRPDRGCWRQAGHGRPRPAPAGASLSSEPASCRRLVGIHAQRSAFRSLPVCHRLPLRRARGSRLGWDG